RKCLDQSRTGSCPLTSLQIVRSQYNNKIRTRGDAISAEERSAFEKYFEYLQGRRRLLPNGDLTELSN
ncbi:MAG: hypothetical protein V4736_03105, partial [Bdellovibrionota bacterium]